MSFSEPSKSLSFSLRKRKLSKAPTKVPSEQYLDRAISLALLSRTLEPARFTMSESILNRQVCCHGMIDILHEHHRFLSKCKGRNICDVESPHLRHNEEILDQKHKQEGDLSCPLKNGDVPKDLENDCRKIWERVDPDSIEGVTFHDLLHFDLPEYPYTTKDQREKLAVLATQTVVRRRDVCGALKIEAEDPIIETVFEGSRTVPGQTLAEIVHAMELHPKRLPFLLRCAEDVVGAQRNMASFLPFVIVFIVALFLIPQFGIKSLFTFKRTMWWPTTDDWMNYCPDGPDEPCHMIKRNLPDLHTLVDTERYFHEEMVWQLWGWSGKDRADLAPWGGAWLVGGMLLRLSPQQQRVDPSQPVSNCASLNLSEPVTEWLIPQTFACSAWSHVVIPFSKTREEAYAMAQQFSVSLGTILEDSDSLAVLEFGAYRPTDGSLTWVRLTATIPNAGSIIPRSRVISFDMKSREKLLPFVVMQLCLLVFNLTTQFYYSAKQYQSAAKIVWNSLAQFSLIPPVIQSILLVLSYIYFDPVEPAHLEQTDFIVAGFDRLARDHDTARDFFGAWIIVFFGLSVRYFKDVVSVGLVVRLIKVALPEVIGLLVVFMFTYLAFVMSAMVLLGGTEYQYSSAVNANAMLLPYFWGSTDFTSIAEENPVLGGLFFYIYQIFVVFFALNLLVAVVTAPLGAVREAANLHLELYDQISKPLSKAPLSVRVGFAFKKFYLPLLAIIPDMLVFAPVTDRWVTFLTLARDLWHYDPAVVVTLDSHIKTARKLTEFLHEAHKSVLKTPWDTLLVEGAEEFKCIPAEPSRKMIFLVNAYSARFNAVRDARLIKILIFFDQMNTDVEGIMSQSRALRTETAEKENEIVRKQDDPEYEHEEAMQLHHSRARLVEVTSPVLVRIRSGVSSFRDKVADKGVNKHEISELQFSFTQYLMRKLQSRRFYPLYYLLIFTMYALFVIPLLSSVQGAAWLNESLHGGLRDFPYLTKCNDQNCSGPSSFTHTKRFTDMGHLNDVYQFFDTIIGPRLFPDKVPYFDGNSTDIDPLLENEHLVYWDTYLRRVGPVQIRQVKGQRTPCEHPQPSQYASQERRDAMNNLVCYTDGSQLSTSRLPVVAELGESTSIYEPNLECAAVGQDFVAGWLWNYPCGGYIANISNTSQLQAAKAWIDNSTRFIDIQIDFRLYIHKLRYHMYVELADGGGTGFVWTRSYPEIEQGLSVMNWCAYAVMIFEGVSFLIGSLRYLYFLKVVGMILKAEHIQPPVPWATIVQAIAQLIISLVVDIAYTRDSFYTVLCTLYLTNRFQQVVVFPTAEVFSRRATTVLRVLDLTGKAVVIVLPFYAVYAAAFTYFGHIIFGPTNLEFATMLTSATTILRGFFGVWDMDSLYDEKPIAAVVLTGLFFIVVLTILANLILSLITGAADEARAEQLALDYIANTTNLLHMPLYYGPFFECWLYWTITRSKLKECLRSLVPNSWFSPQRVPFAITHEGRLALPSETLSWLPFLGCTLTSEVLNALNFDQLPARAVTSAVLLVAKEVRYYEANFKERSFDDENLEEFMRLQVDKCEGQELRSKSNLGALLGNNSFANQLGSTFANGSFGPHKNGSLSNSGSPLVGGGGGDESNSGGNTSKERRFSGHSPGQDGDTFAKSLGSRGLDLEAALGVTMMESVADYGNGGDEDYDEPKENAHNETAGSSDEVRKDPPKLKEALRSPRLSPRASPKPAAVESPSTSVEKQEGTTTDLKKDSQSIDKKKDGESKADTVGSDTTTTTTGNNPTSPSAAPSDFAGINPEHI